MVLVRARQSPDLLDMGTGGGESLARLSYRPPRTIATESWPPNLGVARARLRPLGITVVRVEAAPENADQEPDETRGRLPFPAESFALVSNRHESFVASEVARVLRREGVFVTQQVGGRYEDFYDALGLPSPPVPSRLWDLRLAARQVEAAGLRIVDSGQGVEVTSFADVGAFAWYLKAIPWTVADFSIEDHRAELERLHERIRATGPVTVRQPTFWLEATKVD
ncbi:MAG: Methyltransferase [Thermoleophilia bacterium]|nr:Methyltransferase [Thermoleophilia bacterium]